MHPTSAGVGACRSRSSEDVVESSSLGLKAPVWVPDTASSSCQECSKPFTFWARRHHCRSCGRLLCSSCSIYTVPLHYLNWSVSRVCQSCKERLDSPTQPPRRSRSLSSLSGQEENISKLVREMQMESLRRRSMETSGSSSPIFILPKEILTKIFGYLRHSDVKVCRSVCQYWLEVVETSHFYRDCLISFSKDISSDRFKNSIQIFQNAQFENFRFSGLLPPQSPAFWSCVAERLRSLDLVECEVTDKELTAILLSLRSLRSLSLVNCRDVFMSGNFLSNEAEREEVGRNLEELRVLRLDENKYLSDVLLIRISEITPSLNSLSLSGCNIMNDAGIYLKYYPASQEIQASPSVLTWRILVQVVKRLAPSLTSLNVARNTGVDLEVLSRLPGLSLEELNLSSCGSVTQPGLLSILATNPQLRRLNLTQCRRVFSGLAESTLSVFKCMKVRELSLSQLSIPHFLSVSSVRGLSVLELDSLDAPGTEIIKGLEGLDTKALTSLSARFLGAPAQDLAEVIRKSDFSALRKLDLSHGSESTVTDIVVQAICSSMRNLTHLNLSNNPRISDVGTLGLPLDHLSANSVLEMKEVMARMNQIPLGSRFESQIRLESLRKEIIAESLMEKGMPESGLFLLTKLVELNLSLTSVTSLTLKLGVSAPDLRACCLGHCSAVQDESGLYDFATRHPHLERLELASTLVSDTGLISCLSCLPRLVHLDISSCQAVTNLGLRAVSQVSPQLETLLLSNCSNISLESARAVGSNLPNLSRIQTFGLLSEHRRLLNVYPTVPPLAPPPPNQN